MIFTDDFSAKWDAQRARQQDANGRNRAAVFDGLTRLRIERVEITFDGYGDSGQIEEVTVTGAVDTPSGEVRFETARWDEANETGPRQLADAIECLCYGVLEIEQPGWEINDGSFGTFTFDVAARSIELEFNGRFTNHETTNYTIAEEG